MTFTLESPAFRDGERIPEKYARDGDNVSPPLAWKDAPTGTRSFLLVVEDPDAPSGTFRHWGVYDIEAERSRLPEAMTQGAGHGVNDFGNPQYDGPQPPKGHGVHHYHFRLAALDIETLHCEGRTRIEDMLDRARPHIIEQTELVGTYENA